MKNNKNFDELAKYYDMLYEDKNYMAEVDFLETIFRTEQQPKTILELGCGTGNYTQILAKRGYKVTGIDLSESMLKVAKQKCSGNFIKGNICDISVNEKFDVCIAMFAVMGYITENSNIVKVLKNIHNHLKPNGLFIFDVWNGLAVLRILPESRIKNVENEDFKVIRFAEPKLKSYEHICEVNYKLLILNKKNNTFKDIDEKHSVRFYFPQELMLYLENAGFKVLKVCPFLDLNGRVDEGVWNMAIVAKAVLQ